MATLASMSSCSPAGRPLAMEQRGAPIGRAGDFHASFGAARPTSHAHSLLTYYLPTLPRSAHRRRGCGDWPLHGSFTLGSPCRAHPCPPPLQAGAHCTGLASPQHTTLLVACLRSRLLQRDLDGDTLQTSYSIRLRPRPPACHEWTWWAKVSRKVGKPVRRLSSRSQRPLVS